jgi:hypothetical protein
MDDPLQNCLPYQRTPLLEPYVYKIIDSKKVVTELFLVVDVIRLNQPYIFLFIDRSNYEIVCQIIVEHNDLLKFLCKICNYAHVIELLNKSNTGVWELYESNM